MLKYNEKFAEPDGMAYEILFSKYEKDPFDKSKQYTYVIIALDMDHAIKIFQSYYGEDTFLTILNCKLVSSVIISDAKCVHGLRENALPRVPKYN